MGGDRNTNVVRFFPDENNIKKYMISVSSSELLRAIEAIDTIETDNYRYTDYVDGLISLKVNHYISKFETIKENDGILILEHCEWKKEETGKKAKCVLNVMKTEMS